MQIGEPLNSTLTPEKDNLSVITVTEYYMEDEKEFEEILDSLWLETHKDFGCIHYEKK
jgi:hypothetical protein